MKATLANCGFLPAKLAAYLDCDNIAAAPQHVEWVADKPQTARFVTEEYIDQARGRGQVAWILEPFFLHPDPYLAARHKCFDYVLTHDRTWADNNENWLWYPAGGSWIGFDKWGMHPKTKNVSLLLSNKRMTRGHRLRHEVKERYGGKVDIYGLDHRVTPYEALADYRYSIIIENEKSRGWFTEKLIDCLSVGTIPIYWGDPTIDEWFDARGIAQANGLTAIGGALDWLGEDYYYSSIDSVRANVALAREYRCCEDWIYRHYPFLFEGSEH